MTVGEAVYRIKAFQMMEPNITYSDTGIDAVIGNFTGRAFFYLSLPAGREIVSVKGAETTKINDTLYLVDAKKEHVKITYQEKR